MKYKKIIRSVSIFYFAFIIIKLFSINVYCEDIKVAVPFDTRSKPWTHLKIGSTGDKFTFVVLPDRTGSARPGVFTNAVNVINLMQPDFVISVGDLIEGKHATETEEEVHIMWDEFNDLIKPLNMPFFYCIGNHDFVNEHLRKVWEKRFGPSFYSFTFKSNLFIILNSPYIIHERPLYKGMHEKQVEFIKIQIQKNTNVNHTFAFLHYPIWRGKWKKNKRVMRYWNDIENLFNGRKYTLFSGHAHHYFKEIRNNNKYITVSTAGAKSKQRGVDVGEFDHITWVTVNGTEEPVIANIKLDGVLSEDIKIDLEKLEELQKQNKLEKKKRKKTQK